MSARRLTAIGALGLVLAACGSGSTTTSPLDATTTGGSTATPAPSTDAATTTAHAVASPPTLKPGPDGCDHTQPPASEPQTFTRAPASPVPAGQDATLVLYTSCGELRVFLDRTRGGEVTDAVAGLAAAGFFDGLTFHRVVPGFVAQGGDPTGTGSGGPGFSTRKAPPADYVYQQGDIAMAKTSDEPPGTAGSQFFAITTPGGAAGMNALGPPPAYAVIGHATDTVSLKTLARIDALGVGDGPPVRPLYIWATRIVPEG